MPDAERYPLEEVPIQPTSPIVRLEVEQPIGITRGLLYHPLRVCLEKMTWDRETWPLGPWTPRWKVFSLLVKEGPLQ